MNMPVMILPHSGRGLPSLRLTNALEVTLNKPSLAEPYTTCRSQPAVIPRYSAPTPSVFTMDLAS